MIVGRLSETFALLLREKHVQAATLSADAERAIGRRIAARWAGSIGAIVAVGALGAATVVGEYGGRSGGDSAIKSPIPTPTIGVAVATFPVTGGPEFASATAGLKCGDPAPNPHPAEHDVLFALTQTNAVSPGETIQTPGNMPAVNAHLAQTPGTDLGVVADSGMSLIIERDGVVVGVVPYGAPELGWNAPGGMAASQGQNGAQLVASWIHCPGDDTSTESTLEPGQYDIVGITRVFSTPESVALYQTLGTYRSAYSLDPANLDPQGIYVPGSYDCAQTIDQDSPARACLPDFTPDAKLDETASTITMLYDKKDLREDFSAVLVSEPVTVTIPGTDSLSWMQTYDQESVGVFDSIDAFTCGASAGYFSLASESRDSVYLSLGMATAAAVRNGGDIDATAWALGIPDGSRVELLPGARIVYLQTSTITIPGSKVTTDASTVVASAAISATQPVTTNRFAGPQSLTVKAEPWTMCPGVGDADITWSNYVLLVGQWRITTPDGAVKTVDTAQYLNVY
ncbi:hypothetical protein [Demequina lutea]|uniref:Uncharacterized protein n=1 Tax=Demequina lutea TaxID=431489 RepID=A0A7Z0CGD6_9MICO|nr:hypothetical protein [Demequina lutea]NYI40276.1 hypothetical protein [Demequina lutea]